MAAIRAPLATLLGYALAMLPMEAKTWVEANAGWIGFVSLVITVVSLAAAFYFYFRPHRSKRLSWEYTSANRIIQVSKTGRHQLPVKVMYGEDVVENPNLIVLRIANGGRQEIRKDDFDRPITIEFRESGLLALDVIDKSTPNMNITFKVDTTAPNKVTVNPLLLNEGDWLDLQFVTDGSIEEPSLQSRIAGQTGEPFNRPALREKRSIIVAFGVFTLLLGFTLGGLPLTPEPSLIRGAFIFFAIPLTLLAFLNLLDVLKGPLKELIRHGLKRQR
jgi:hypothetical protein